MTDSADSNSGATSSSHDAPEYGAEAETEQNDYRPLSSMAVLTCLAGVASFLAILSPVLWVLPAIAVVLGLAALRELHRTPERTGRRAALAGIALALFFGSWAPVRYLSRQRTIKHYARQFADDWLVLFRHEEFFKAHQLQLYKMQRAGGEVSLKEHYEKNSMAKTELDTFFEADPAKKMRSMGKNATFRFVRTEAIAPEPTRDSVTLRYVMTYREKGKTHEMPLFIVLLRALDLVNGGHDWQIERVASPIDAAAS